jgi:hypothetical protein
MGPRVSLHTPSLHVATVPCIVEDNLYVLPMNVDNLNTGTTFWMYVSVVCLRRRVRIIVEMDNGNNLAPNTNRAHVCIVWL